MTTHPLLQKLEEKIDNAIETIELLRLELKEQEEKNQELIQANHELQNKHSSWEQNLNAMLQKLAMVDPSAVAELTSNSENRVPEPA